MQSMWPLHYLEKRLLYCFVASIYCADMNIYHSLRLEASGKPAQSLVFSRSLFNGG